MKTLTRTSTDFILQWILNILTLRKRKIKDWKMDMDQWIKAMDLSEMRNYLQSISVLCESLVQIALQTFEEFNFSPGTHLWVYKEIRNEL